MPGPVKLQKLSQRSLQDANPAIYTGMPMKTLDPNFLPAEVWRPLEPISGRSSNRISERELERIPAWIRVRDRATGSEKDIPVALWDCSAFGFAILMAAGKNGNDPLMAGDGIRLKLGLAGADLTADCIVQNTSFFRNSHRIGLSRTDMQVQPVRRDPDGPQIGVPKGGYLRLPETSDIKAEIRNAILFGEWSTIRLSGIRSGLALDFTSKDGCLPLFTGQELEIRLSLPTSNANSYTARISRLERLDEESLRVRMEPVALSASLANDLAELLATECRISPDTLKDLGFPIRFFRNRVAAGFVESMEDYEKVVQLRRNAYVEAGKKEPDTTPEKMSSQWDKLSRILCIFHEDTLVACATMTFPSSDTPTLRSQSAFPGGEYPCPVPAKTDFIEINGLCTHKDYRKGDLLHAVFEHVARAFLFSDRNYILTLADDTLLPLYGKIGFVDLGQECTFLDRRHHLILGHKRTLQSGWRMPVLAWNRVYGDLVADLLERKALKIGLRERLLVRAKLALRPLADKLAGDRIESIFRKNLRTGADRIVSIDSYPVPKGDTT
ncbi:MAG: hypothetical protein JWP91_4005 [Fibrobacteres bacterium]|nr:hypothetical protein [Fibrobacterota bacterium]